MEKSNYLKIDNSKTLTKVVYDKLLNAIITGFFKPGDRLLERELSEEMGISRTPIREALRELQNQKLVQSSPYKGVIVTKLTKKEAVDVLEVCSNLEGLIAKLVAQNCTDESLSKIYENIESYRKMIELKDSQQLKKLNHEFHVLLSDICDNDIAKDLYTNVRALMSLIGALTIDRYVEDTYLEHKRIFDAIKNRDHERAEKEAINHIQNIKEMLLSGQEKEPNNNST